MNKSAQPVAVQPPVQSAIPTSPLVLNPLQPSGAPASAPVAPIAGAKPPATKSMSATSGAELGAKSSSLRRAEVLSVLHKYGMCVRKSGQRARVKMAAAPTFFQSRGTDTLRLARYLGNRFNIDSLKGLSAGGLTAAGPDRIAREQQLLGRIGAGAAGAAGLGAAGLGYGAAKMLGGSEDKV